ncbi:peptidyl-prolyl cis-trans isomerase FKBP7 isoform X2 [Dromiciops gliroides]|uniref:peptidyl-prolyl cis-trans isomerase FKBP7 isoform X2 n=1 Tax=Dromiciops gliroides TaxID=33562 RepID=UPI001CC6CAC5|nr:peptidyl-prolyl cis-trans isomerase FKBP7 isoform X2 [Dromiciops gliroides]
MYFSFKCVLFLQALSLFSLMQGQKLEESMEEVKIEVLHLPGNCSSKSKKGDLLNAHYDGYLANGTKFYCSRTQNKGHPKWFVLGVGQVIKGLDIAMMGMCSGEKRKVTIPPSLAYGKEGYDVTILRRLKRSIFSASALSSATRKFSSCDQEIIAGQIRNMEISFPEIIIDYLVLCL